MTIKKFKLINLSGYKLVFASASVGNVGQLTCDLIIEMLNLEKIGMVRIINFLINAKNNEIILDAF